MGHKRDLWIGRGLAFAAFASVAFVWLLDPRFCFSLWDNFENFTGITIYIHRLWLQGHIPIINIHQALGTPMAGNGYSGVLYFPFTIVLFVLDLLGLKPQMLPEVMALIHFPLGVVGWWKLLRAFDVSEEFAIASAFGIVSCGFYIVGYATWQHIGPEYAWFPWTLYFCFRIWRDEQLWTGYAGFGATWFMMAMASHIQHLIYIAVHLGLFCMALVFSDKRRARLGRWLVPLIWMPILASPSFVYLWFTRALSPRADRLPDEVFFEASLPLKQLLGIFSPFFDSGGGAFGLNSSMLFFTGISVPIGLGLIFVRRSRWVWPVLLTGLIFLDFSLGDHSLIYRFTKYIPVWSSFRWPYKFSFHAISMLAVAASIGLSSNWPKIKICDRALLIGAALLLSLLFARPSNWIEILFLSAQVGLMASWFIPSIYRFWFTAIAAALCLSLALVQTFAQPSHRYQETLGAYDATYFSIDTQQQYRMVPVNFQDCQGEICRMQAQSTFDSATSNGYLSLSGTIVGTLPADFANLIAGNVWGILNGRLLASSVASPLLRSLGVRYYLSQDQGGGNFEEFFRTKGLRRLSGKEGWTIFEDSSAQKAASVPERVLPVEVHGLDLRMFDLVGNNTALVEGLDSAINPQATDIKSMQWLPGRGLQARVENLSRGKSFLLMTVYPYPFLKAYLDDSATPFYRSNFTASGVVIPPGEHTVLIEASSTPLFAALVAALLAYVIGLGLALFKIDDHGPN